jgi:CheY-like chemotaxis protein
MDVQPILVIEDEPLIRLDLIDILEQAGFTVEATVDASTAIAAIDGHDHLAGIVTDINLGSDVRGWVVARHARQKFPDLAVVYITGDSAAEWTTEGVPNSVVLQKPFADAQVVNAITTILNAAPAHPNPAMNGKT